MNTEIKISEINIATILIIIIVGILGILAVINNIDELSIACASGLVGYLGRYRTESTKNEEIVSEEDAQ